jgi:hypothetical protein
VDGVGGRPGTVGDAVCQASGGIVMGRHSGEGPVEAGTSFP